MTNIKILRIILIKYFIRCCVFYPPSPARMKIIRCDVVLCAEAKEMRWESWNCIADENLLDWKGAEKFTSVITRATKKKLIESFEEVVVAAQKKNYSDKSEKVGFSARWMFSVLIAQQHKIKEKLSSLQRCSKNWSENKSLRILTIERVLCKKIFIETFPAWDQQSFPLGITQTYTEWPN